MDAAIGFEVWTRRRCDSTEPWEDCTHQVHDRTVDVVSVVAQALDRVRHLDWETELTIRFDAAPDARTRDEIMAAVRSRYMAADRSDDEADDPAGAWAKGEVNDEYRIVDRAGESITEDGDYFIDADDHSYFGPTVRVDARLGPPLSMSAEHSYLHLIGLWPTPQTFCALPLLRGAWPISEDELLAEVFWSPDPSASDTWGDRLTVAVPGVLCLTNSLIDEVYVRFQPAPQDPEALAREILAFIDQCASDIHGAETWLPILYSLIGTALNEVPPFRISLLPGTTSESNDHIMCVTVNATGSTREALTRLGAPTDEQRAALAAAVRTYFTGDQNPYFDGRFPYLWQTVVEAAERR